MSAMDVVRLDSDICEGWFRVLGWALLKEMSALYSFVAVSAEGSLH